MPPVWNAHLRRAGGGVERIHFFVVAADVDDVVDERRRRPYRRAGRERPHDPRVEGGRGRIDGGLCRLFGGRERREAEDKRDCHSKRQGDA